MILAVGAVRAHARRSALVTVVLAATTTALIVGGAVVSSIEVAIEDSVARSWAGHLQVFPAERPETASLIESVGRSSVVHRFDAPEKLVNDVEQVAGVEAVVPLSTWTVTLSAPIPADLALGGLRRALRHGAWDDVELFGAVLRQTAADVASAFERQSDLSLADRSAEVSAARRVADPAYWENPQGRTAEILAGLEADLEPLLGESKRRSFLALGTNPKAFESVFPRFRRTGATVPAPSGRRGFLLHEGVYDALLETSWGEVFRLLRGANGASPEAVERRLGGLASNLPSASGAILARLSREERAAVKAALDEFQGETAGTLLEALGRFLTLDLQDLPALEKKRAFYEAELRERVGEHLVEPGDLVVLNAFSSLGFPTAQQLVFEGTFVFQGQEGLDQPVISMLTDLETLAAFIALPTAEDRRDFELLEKEFEGLDDDDGSSADIEAAWFAADDDATGDADAAPVNVAPSPDDGLSDPAPETAPSPTVNARAVSDRVAPVMGLAVVAAPSTSLSALRDTLSAALGPTYRVADWQSSAGLLGTAGVAFRAVFYAALAMLFAVAALIASNLLLIAWADRTRELGTLRAVGASRPLLVLALLVEALLLAAAAVVVGGVVGAAICQVLSTVGIPAPDPVLAFVFGGRALFPTFQLVHVAGAAILVATTAMVAAVYPAWTSSRSSPREAMS